jgi:serine/threonine-protein kinase SRPK3
MSSSSHDGGTPGVENPNVRFTPIEGAECLERYRLGGFRSTTIGELLRNRYRIVHKLGFGTYSTTWLAHDQQTSNYVAMKISIADDEQTERQIMRLLANTNSTHPGRDIVLKLLDTFNVISPNGTHRCITTITARASIARVQNRKYPNLFHIRVARVIIAQLIQAVAYMHSRGVVHSGMQ